MEKGEKYDTRKLVYTGWSNPNDEDITGYSAWAYFDAHGRYLGPDKYGIEPIFEELELPANQG
jgi:hypothetical protein